MSNVGQFVGNHFGYAAPRYRSGIKVNDVRDGRGDLADRA